MKQKLQIITTLFILFTTMVSAQEPSLNLKGKVYDKGNQKGIEKAEVRLFDDKGSVLKTVITNSQGQYQLDLQSEINRFKVEAKAKNYNQAEVLVKNSQQTIVVDFGLNLEATVIKADLSTIYFDFNSSYLTSQAKAELAKVVAYMREHTEAKLRVSAHTDSRGPNNYNDWLSARRGQRVIDWLVQQGIQLNRIEEHHYGKAQLKNHCAEGVSCTAEQHRENRRCVLEFF